MAETLILIGKVWFKPIANVVTAQPSPRVLTPGVDSQVKVWDLRMVRPLHAYFAHSPATTLDISQRGLLGVGYGRKMQVRVLPTYLCVETLPSAPELVRLHPLGLLSPICRPLLRTWMGCVAHHDVAPMYPRCGRTLSLPRRSRPT